MFSLHGDLPYVQAIWVLALGPVDLVGPVGPVGLVGPVGAGEGGRHVGEITHPASLASWAPSHWCRRVHRLCAWCHGSLGGLFSFSWLLVLLGQPRLGRWGGSAF